VAGLKPVALRMALLLRSFEVHNIEEIVASTSAMPSHCTGAGHRKLTTLLKRGLDCRKVYEAGCAYGEDPNPNSSKDA